MCSARVTNLDQRSYVKIETVRGRTPSEIFNLLREVRGDDTMDRSTISRRATKFKSGVEDVTDAPRAGRPRTSTEGVLVCDRVDPKSTVDKHRYAFFLRKKLRPQICKIRPKLLQAGVVILHDNARPHAAGEIQSVFDEYGWEVLPHPAYSPDMSPPDYDAINKLKEPLRGVRFPDLELLNTAMSRRI